MDIHSLQNAVANEQFEAIDEKNYRKIMQANILPCLNALRNSVLLNREGTQKLYCEYYLQPSGKVIGSVFISHGFTESCGKYQEVIYYFLKAGYNVCMVEHRGHGRSRRTGAKNIAQSPTHVENFQFYIYDMAYAVEKVLKKNLPAPYYLFAHSMGGAVGAAYLEQYPDTFSKAVLSAPMFEINRGGLPLPLVKTVTAILCLLGKGGSFLPGQTPFSPRENSAASAATSIPRYRYYFRQQLATPEFQNGGSSCRWAKESIHAAERLLKPSNCAKIKIPILLFQAENDDFVCPGGQNKFIKQISNGKLVFVPGSKHEIYLSTNDILENYWPMIFDFLK